MLFMRRPKAFILLGGLGAVSRNFLYIEELKKRNLEVLLIAPDQWQGDFRRNNANPEHVVAQITEAAFVPGSSGDSNSFTSGVISQALGWREKYLICGVYGVGEVLIEQAGILADAFGVSFPGLRATRVCRSKYLQRLYLPEWSPECTVVPPSARASVRPGDVRFPVVTKPAGRYSSSGVESHRDGESLRRALSAYPSWETVLIEEQVSGQEFSVESLVQGGRVLFDSVTRKDTTESFARTFVELRHSVPSAPGPASDRLIKASRAVLEKLEFQDGIAHSEWRVRDDGSQFLMEIAARTPGDGLLPLYRLATGYPLEPEIIRVCLNEQASYPPPRRYARQVYLEHPVGWLEDVTVNWPGVRPAWVGRSGVWPSPVVGDAGDRPCLRAVLVQQDRGMQLSSLHESDDRAVSFLIDASSPALLDSLETEVRAAISIHVADTAPAEAR